MFTRFAALLLIAGALAAADVAFTGTWAVGAKPAIASDATTVVATFNLNATC
jgi:hypothetical protein